MEWSGVEIIQWGVRSTPKEWFDNHSCNFGQAYLPFKLSLTIEIWHAHLEGILDVPFGSSHSLVPLWFYIFEWWWLWVKIQLCLIEGGRVELLRDKNRKSCSFLCQSIENQKLFYIYKNLSQRSITRGYTCRDLKQSRRVERRRPSSGRFFGAGTGAGAEGTLVKNVGLGAGGTKISLNGSLNFIYFWTRFWKYQS